MDSLLSRQQQEPVLQQVNTKQQRVWWVVEVCFRHFFSACELSVMPVNSNCNKNGLTTERSESVNCNCNCNFKMCIVTVILIVTEKL